MICIPFCNHIFVPFVSLNLPYNHLLKSSHLLNSSLLFSFITGLQFYHWLICIVAHIPTMLPSSSSHLARYGHLNHYKKFWLLQTQLEKQEPTSTTLSIGVSGNSNAKENKPVISSNAFITNGEHLINNSNTIAGHGCYRADMVSTSVSSSRAGPFPYSSNEPSGSFKVYNGRLGYNQNRSNGSLRDSPALSLAVNCESVAQCPINFLNQPSRAHSSHSICELQLCNSPQSAPALRGISGQAKAEECDSSECSNGRGEKRVLVYDHASASPSTSSVSLSSMRHHGPADPTSLLPSPPQGLAVLPSSSRTENGCSGSPRTCTLCGTSKTPLWRSGPDGPKSLCNACGIRVKKTKRLQAAIEAAGAGAERIISSTSSPTGSFKRLLTDAAATTKVAKRGVNTHKRKLSMEAAENQSDPIVRLKKRKKAAGGRSSWPLPNVVVGLESDTCHRIFGDAAANLAAGVVNDRRFSNLFAKDVEEAAVLLMALSCGLDLS